MSDAVIWFSEGAHDINLFPGYEVVGMARDERMAVNDRLRAGELVAEDELPDAFGPSKLKRPQKLGADRPIFESNNSIVVHRGVAEVMRRFDLGRTILKPVRIHLPEDGGTNEDYLVLATANLKTTIDDAKSEPRRRGRSFRSNLYNDGEIMNARVVALPSACEGPDIWTDRSVVDTLFLSDPLARALIEAGFNKGRRGGMQLRQVRVGGPPVPGAPDVAPKKAG